MKLLLPCSLLLLSIQLFANPSPKISLRLASISRVNANEIIPKDIQVLSKHEGFSLINFRGMNDRGGGVSAIRLIDEKKVFKDYEAIGKQGISLVLKVNMEGGKLKYELFSEIRVLNNLNKVGADESYEMKAICSKHVGEIGNENYVWISLGSFHFKHMESKIVKSEYVTKFFEGGRMFVLLRKSENL